MFDSVIYGQFRVKAIKGDISAMVLRELMGHESFITTLRYVKISEKKLARGYFSAMEYQNKEANSRMV